VFSALDHLNGWQLLAVLSPIVIIMTLIRKREEKASSMSFQSMNTLQQGWVFLSLLAPGLAAKILNLLTDEERERVLQAGGALSGSAGRVAFPVLDAFFKADGAKGAPSKDIEEVCRFINLKYENNPKQLVVHYRKAYF
jgi:hypothetical protein